MSHKDQSREPSTNTSSLSSSPSQSISNGQGESEGVILGPDGKPCRACSNFKSWAKQMQGDVRRSIPSMASAVRALEALMHLSLFATYA